MFFILFGMLHTKTFGSDLENWLFAGVSSTEYFCSSPY